MATSGETRRRNVSLPYVAAIYCRVSTGGQAAEGTSLESQEAACRAHAATLGYTVEDAHVYRDVHTGAELHERPRLTALRAAIRRGEVRALVAHSLDRLSREQGHVYILDDECQRHDVALLFVTEEFEKTAIGKMIRSVKSFAAELEREKIRERTLRGRRTLAESGRLHNAGPDLYGYRRDREARVRLVHDGEAAVVRRIFRWVGEESLAVRGVAARLNAEGVPPPSRDKLTYPDPARTPRWAPSQLHRLLTNPAYKGEPYAWRTRRSKTHAGLHRPPEEWLPLDPATTPALVPPALWEAAQARLASNTGAATRNERRRYLLRGHIFCAVCGARMYSDIEKGHYRVYRCSSRDKGAGACGGKRVPADAIEARVWERLGEAIRDPSLIHEQWQSACAAGPDPRLSEDRATATRALEKLARQQERLVRRLREAEDDDLAALIERELTQLGAERRSLRATVATIDARMSEARTAVDQLGALADYCARVAANLAEFDFERKRLALAAFGIRVEANGLESVGPWRVRGSIPLGEVGVMSRSSGSYVPPPPRPPGRA